MFIVQSPAVNYYEPHSVCDTVHRRADPDLLTGHKEIADTLKREQVTKWAKTHSFTREHIKHGR